MVEYLKMPLTKFQKRLKPIITKLEEKAENFYVAQRFLEFFNNRSIKNLTKIYSSKILGRKMILIPQNLLQRTAEAELYLSSF